MAARTFTIPLEDRADILQETLTDLWRSMQRPGFIQGDDFDGLVRTIAYRRCIDWRRRQRITREIEEGDRIASHDPEQALAERQQAGLGRRLLAALSASCLQVIRLRLFEERSYRQIADAEGRSEGAVRNQMYKCLQRARTLYREIAAEERG